MKLIERENFPLFNSEREKRDNLIGRKLHEARKARSLTLIELSLILRRYGVDVSDKAINKWEKGGSVPNAYQMTALCRVLGIDDGIRFFSDQEELNAEGWKRVTEYRNDLIASGRYEPVREEAEIIYVQMPVSTLGASAGTGNYLDEENFELVSFPKSDIPEGAEFGIYIVGDSMEPVYSNGQLVWIQLTPDIMPGEVGLFVLDGNGYIKMYGERTPDSPEDYTDSSGVMHPQPVLISLNRKYSPIPVTHGKYLKIVGKVL